MGKDGMRIVVAGDKGTGKSSLILTTATDLFPKSVPPLLPPIRLRRCLVDICHTQDTVPTFIIDTSAGPEGKAHLVEELKKAHAVMLTYACDRPETLDHLLTFWLPKLQRLGVKVPVVLVGCKLDLRGDHQQVSLEEVMQQFPQIETCLECSAFDYIKIPEVFNNAMKAMFRPTTPLFDRVTQSLKDRCVRALKRIFFLCDKDRDGALSDAEWNDYQVRCFNAPLPPSELARVKRFVEDKRPGGVNDNGLTLSGFLFLHASDIKKGWLSSTWTVLRKFKYNNDLKIVYNLSQFLETPDQRVELSNKALEYLKTIFTLFDGFQDGALKPIELEDLFSTAADCPCLEEPYKDAAEKNKFGLPLNGFLSEWALMTLLDPGSAIGHLICIGYPGGPSSAIRVTRRRQLDRENQQADRTVFQCFVFGPKKAGKSALLNSFIGRPFSESYVPTLKERFAVNVVDLPGAGKKTLVLREIPEDGVKKFLSNKEALVACDLAVFVHDRESDWILRVLSSDEASWKKSAQLLFEVATHGENTGSKVHCLIVAAKDDLDPYPTAIQESSRMSHDMGIEAPISVSCKLGDLNEIFLRMVRAAEQPHLSVPESEAAIEDSSRVSQDMGIDAPTPISCELGDLNRISLQMVGSAEQPHLSLPEIESGEKRKNWKQLMKTPLMLVSAAAIVGIAGALVCRVCAARRNAS